MSDSCGKKFFFKGDIFKSSNSPKPKEIQFNSFLHMKQLQPANIQTEEAEISFYDIFVSKVVALILCVY